MKLVTLLPALLMLLVQESAKADEPSSAAKVSCKIDVSFSKKKDDKANSNPSLDLRIVTLSEPIAKLSGKSAILESDGITTGCLHHYEGKLDENTLISACSNHKNGEDLKLETVEIMLLKPEADMNGNFYCNPEAAGPNRDPSAAAKPKRVSR